MKHADDNAMAMGAIIFGIFCLVAMVAGIVYILSINSLQAPITDTFGNTIGDTGNSSQAVINVTSEIGSATVVPVILIAGAVAVCAIIFMLWVMSKSGGRYW